MIRSFRRKALARYWNAGKTGRLPARDVPRIRLLLQALDAAEGPADLDLPGFGLAASGDAAGRSCLSASAASVIMFGWSGTDAIEVELQQDEAGS